MTCNHGKFYSYKINVSYGICLFAKVYSSLKKIKKTLEICIWLRTWRYTIRGERTHLNN